MTAFKFGLSAASVSALPAYLADAHKIFEKHGLKVDIVSMEGGTRGIQVLLSGEIQAMSVGLAPTIQANNNGADLRLIASTISLMPFTFFAQPRFKSAADLKGGSIGISTFGSETDIAVSIALRKWGFTRSDVTISQLGGTTQRYNALLAGRIDAVPLLDPLTTIARQKGGYTVVLDLAADRTPWIFDAVVVTRQALTGNRDAIERFLKAQQEGARLGLAEPDKVKAIIAQRWKTKDQTVIDASEASFRQLVPPDLSPPAEGVRNVFEQLDALGAKITSRNVADHVDYGPLEAIKSR